MNFIINRIFVHFLLFFNESIGKVAYVLVSEGEQSPIGYGSDGNDVGAWNSGFVLSTNNQDFLKEIFKITYNTIDKNITLINNSNEQLSVEIFNILGINLFSNKKITTNIEIDAASFKKGIYICKVKFASKWTSIKFVVY